MRYPSPLRYPGGKNILSKYIKVLIKENRLLDGVYVEPFAGGASVALSLLFSEYVSKIVINDLNKSVYSFWYSVLHYPKELCELIINTDVTCEEWYKQKEIQKKTDASFLELGFSTFFLNRTNRSGIINGGMIGGSNQSGNWKIDARFNKVDLIKRIQRIALYKNRIELYNLDASELILNVLPQLPRNKTFIYFDPPYYKKGKDLYQNHYNHEDHVKLSKLILGLSDFYWLITYDNTEPIRLMYSNQKHLIYSLNYSAANRYSGSEIMIFSDNLKIPPIDNPVKI